MNQFLSNKIIASIVALALLVGVGVLVSSGDTSSTTRNAALVVVTPCTKPGQVTKVSKQSVVCAALSPKNIWYPVFQEKKWICAKLGITRKQNGVFSVCGKSKSSKKRWFLTKPLMANSNPGLPTTDQDAFIKLTTNPELIVETSPTTPPALAATTETTLTPTTETSTTETPATSTPTTVKEPTSTPTTVKEPTSTTTTVKEPTSTTIPKIYQVGEIGPGGGIVFYVAPTTNNLPTSFTCGVDLTATCTYLEVATTDGTTPSTWTPATKAQWGCHGNRTGATAIAIGTGKANTDKILAACKDLGIAADVANKYSTTSTAGAPGAAGQWFLPSIDELNELCKIYSNGRKDIDEVESKQNGCTGNESPTGGFAADAYWSSSESDSKNASYKYFGNGLQGSLSKYNYYFYVRPVRAF